MLISGVNAALKTEVSQTADGYVLLSREQFRQLIEAHIRPTFVRLPKPGERRPHTGLSRDSFYDLIARRGVESHLLKEKGVKRGVRVVGFNSLVSAIETAPTI